VRCVAQIADGLSLLVDAEGTLKRSTGTPSNKTIAMQVASYGDDGKKMLLASIVAIDTEMTATNDAKHMLSLCPRGPLRVPRTVPQEKVFDELTRTVRSLRDLRKVYTDALCDTSADKALDKLLGDNRLNITRQLKIETKLLKADTVVAKETAIEKLERAQVCHASSPSAPIHAFSNVVQFLTTDGFAD
jgi:hypothetical protein